MCLITCQLKPKVAGEDIICYKRVAKSKIKGIYRAEHQDFEYIIRRLYTNNINIKCNGVKTNHRIAGTRFISNFMFHSYQLPYHYSIYADTLVKCIIPKGAYYFEGIQGNSWGYASSQIKILEEV